jgi:hypothetical protein
MVAAMEIPSGNERKKNPAISNRMLCASKATSPTCPAKTVIISNIHASSAIITPPESPSRTKLVGW